MVFLLITDYMILGPHFPRSKIIAFSSDILASTTCNLLRPLHGSWAGGGLSPWQMMSSRGEQALALAPPCAL